jgi:hypothetical protein
MRLAAVLLSLLSGCALTQPYREAVLVVRCNKAVTAQGSKAKLVVILVRESLGRQVQTLGSMEVDGDCRWLVETEKR